MKSQHDSGALNNAQRQAVNVDKGPVLVVAGAGTGKTRVIVERVRRLIHGGVAPGSILALTFTEKAAGEMLDRLSADSLSLSSELTASTFNGFGNDLLCQYGAEWGLGTVRLLGETGQLVFLREHLDRFGLDYFAPVSNPDGQLANLAGYVSRLKQQLVRPERYTEFADRLPASDEAEKLEKQRHQELAAFYATYLALCREKQVIDYDDQLFLTIELLHARPNILRKLRQRYEYVLVDEFQDTNAMQSALVDLLAGERQNIMVVGDDDQSIYGWRGATLANILDFKRRYPETKDITLIENYRSTQPILDAAYRLIQHNNPDRLEIINQLDKRLRSQTTEGSMPAIRHFGSFDAELSWIADDIARRIKAGQPASSIAVLARRTQGVEKAHEALELRDIPHAIAGLTSDMYEQPAVRQVIEGLKAVADPLDDLALFHVLSGPLFGMSQSILSGFANEARLEFEPLADVIHRSSETEFKQALAAVEAWRRDSAEQSVGSLAYDLITQSGWKDRLYESAERDQVTATQVQALSKFFRTLKEFERIADVPSVQNYLINLPVLRAGGSDFEDASLEISDSEVNVLSVHRAKGLEWDTVYVIDCTEGSFPLRNRGGAFELPDELKAARTAADEHLAEERRLMYVAATRARQELILSYSDYHGSSAKRRPSRFLDELLGDQTMHEQSGDEQISLELFSPKTSGNKPLPLPRSMKSGDTVVLSASQIATWLDCPQDFYYKFILGVPQPPNPRQQYGTAIHAAIEHIHEGRRQDDPPSLDSIWESVKAALPKTGYVSPGIRKRDHQSAEMSVKKLYERFMGGPLPLESEKPFSVDVPDIGLRIRGRLDAVYQAGNGVEIRDYKTSTSVKTPEQAKSRATNSKQLTLYALAWRLEHDEMPALLTLDFVETGQLGSIKKQPKSLETLTGKLAQMVDDLNRGHYPPGKSHDYCAHPK